MQFETITAAYLEELLLKERAQVGDIDLKGRKLWTSGLRFGWI